MTQTRMIEIARIDAGERLRALDPDWVALLAEEIAHSGHFEPIRVVERGDGFKLVDGARRLAAITLQGLLEVEARVEPTSVLVNDSAVRLAEIKGNMLRGDLTVLDRARYLATWREIHEALHPAPKRGRKPLKSDEQGLQEMSAQCANIFSDAARAALGFSQRTVYLLLKIATIEPQVAAAIALHPVADKRGDLLALADLTPARQRAVVTMLTAEPAQATSVAEAIALLDSVPAPKVVPVYERFYQRFTDLKPADKERFYDLNSAEIEAWFAKRSAALARKAAG